MTWIANLYTSVPLVVQGAIGLMCLLLIVVSSRVLVSWIRSALLERMPKPFLGDDSNSEWAELKRAELGSLHLQQTIHAGDEASSNEMSPPFSRPQQTQYDPHERDHLRSERLEHIEPHSDEHFLVREWLSSMRHPDDDWAAKLLGDRENPKQG